MESYDSQFMRLPLEIRNVIYGYLSEQPTYLSQKISHPFLPRLRETCGENWRLSSARVEHDVFHQFGIPVSVVFYSEHTNFGGTLESRRVPVVFQYRLLNRAISSEISQVVFGGTLDGAELWITATNDFIELCNRAAANEARNDSRVVGTMHADNVEEAYNILGWIRQWARLVFLLPESHFPYPAALLQIVDTEPEHRIRVVITGLEDYFWDS